MNFERLVASVLAVCVVAPPALAQDTSHAPVGSPRGKPEPVPLTDPIGKETPQEIAADSARDLKDSRFYNRPGATRAQYDADWQACRLIARGSLLPTGAVPSYYNNPTISPIGGAIGSVIGAAIAEGIQRRANRRACLLIRGWRLVKVPPAQAAKVQAMSSAERDAYIDGIVGAARVDGEITERTSFAQPVDPVMALDAPVIGPTVFYTGKKVDPVAPFPLAVNEAAIVVAYRRPGPHSAKQVGVVQFARYDTAARDLVYQPKDWKKRGDRTIYHVDAPTRDKKAGMEVQVFRVTPGDYVIAATAVGLKIATSSNCFGAPTFRVNAGEVGYVGDFIPIWNAKLADGTKASTLAYAAHLEDTRRALATKQPALAAGMKPVRLYNRATYACSATMMDRWDVLGAPELPAPPTIARAGG